MRRIKLYLKTLISLLATGTIFGSFATGLYVYGLNDQGGTHYSFDPLKNNLSDLKKVNTYKAFLKDPITFQKIGDYDYYENSVGGVPFWEWFKNYERKYKKTPYLVVYAGTLEFQNFYLEAVLPGTFIDFVKWFANDVPWGPELSSMSYYRLQKGLMKGGDSTVTYGSYKSTDGLRQISLYPDSYFKETENQRFLMRLTKDPITAAQIPLLVAKINKTNAELLKKYGRDFWYDHAVRLYSLQKKEGKYIPIVSNVGNLIDKLEAGMPTGLEKVSDYDVQWNHKTMQARVLKRDAIRFNIEKSSPRIGIWASLAGKKWKGLSFGWLKYTTHHEFGHLQTLSYAQGYANNFVGLKVPSIYPNTLRSGYDFDEINRYLQARVPQIRALRVALTLRQNEKNKWDWNFYQDRLQDWKDKKIKTKPNPRDFDQVAFEYKPNGLEKWTRESVEKIFGNKVDASNPQKAPYQIDPEEFLATLKAKKWPRFFIYSLKDAREFARVTKIPVYALFIMNAFDSLAATRNPTLNVYSGLNYRGRKFKRNTLSYGYGAAIPNKPKILDANNNFVGIKEAMPKLQAWNKVPLLIDISNEQDIEEDIETKKKLELTQITWTKNGVKRIEIGTYKLNPLARDQEGNLLVGKEEQVVKILKDLYNGFYRGVRARGSEYLLARSLNLGFFDDISFNLLSKPENISTWQRPPVDKVKNTTFRDGAKGKLVSNVNKIFTYLNANTKIAHQNRLLLDINLKKLQNKKKIQNSYLLPSRWPIEYIEIEDGKDTHIIRNLTNGDGIIYRVNAQKKGEIDKKNPNMINIFMIPKEAKCAKIDLKKKCFPNPTKVYIVLGKKFLARFKNPVLKKIVLKFKEEPRTKKWRPPVYHPSTDKTDYLGYMQLLKWLKQPNIYASAARINKAQAHYTSEFSEALTRDWVQITQSITKDFKFNYNSYLFPFSNKLIGINNIFDPTIILSQTYNPKTQKTFIQIIDNQFLNQETEQVNMEYKREFVHNLYDFIKNDEAIIKDELLKSFFARDEEAKSGKTNPANNNLSFLNTISTVSIESAERTANLIEGSYIPLFGWTAVTKKHSTFYRDRWLRSSLATSHAKEGTADSWVFYNSKRKPLPYAGDLKNISGQSVTTRPEAYWTFLLKSGGVGIRNVAGMWLQKKRDAIAMWGFIPLAYKPKVKYLQFENQKTGEVIRKPVRFDVDNLFYYDQEQGQGNRRTLKDEGFTSWNIDYIVLGTWRDSDVANGAWKMNFVDHNGKAVAIFWNDRKITMTGNGKMRVKMQRKTTQHIVSLNWKPRTFTPSYIEQNEKGEDIIYIQNQFPI